MRSLAAGARAELRGAAPRVSVTCALPSAVDGTEFRARSGPQHVPSSAYPCSCWTLDSTLTLLLVAILRLGRACSTRPSSACPAARGGSAALLWARRRSAFNCMHIDIDMHVHIDIDMHMHMHMHMHMSMCMRMCMCMCTCILIRAMARRDRHVCAGQVAACALEAALRGRAEVVPGLLPRLYVGLTDRRLLPVPVARGLAAFCFADTPF